MLTTLALLGGISLDWNYGFHVAKKFTSRYAIAFEVNVINMTSKIKIIDSLDDLKF